MAKHVIFWGCYIPARFPGIEKSIRIVLDRLGVDFADLQGTTCCPEKSIIKNMSEEIWHLTAARNLCLAEEQGDVLVTPCNGCYTTLKSVDIELKTDPNLLKKTNAKLAQIGKEFKGRVEVKHLIELLHDDIGTEVVKRRVEKALTGLNIATHTGCHMVRPSNAITFDDPLEPTKLDALVEALGANAVNYDTKMLCCGGALSGVGNQEEAVALARTKLLELQRLGVDALTLVCPLCFLQYDFIQYFIQRRGEEIQVPVLHFAELLGLVLGVEHTELNLDLHRVNIQPFLDKWLEREAELAKVREHFDLSLVRACYECGACVNDCPVAQSTPIFEPNVLIGKVLEGKIDELLESPEIWMCVECYTCYELCPQRFGMLEVFRRLKQLAMEKGIRPPALGATADKFRKSGRFIDPQKRLRQKLGLPEAPEGGIEELKRLIEGSE